MPEDQLSDDEDGRRQYPEQSFIEAIEHHETATTTDITDYVGCTQQAALYRLNKMEQEETVSSKKIGNTLIWSLND